MGDESHAEKVPDLGMLPIIEHALGALDRTLRVWQNDEFFVRQGVFLKEYHWYFEEKQRRMAGNWAF